MSEHNKHHPKHYRPRKLKLSRVHRRILQYAEEHDGPVNPRKFMRATGVSESWSYLAFSGLRNSGYLRVTATPADARGNSCHWYERTDKEVPQCSDS